MRSYNSGGYGTNDRWFRVGNIDVTTTIAVIGLGVLSVFLYAFEGADHPITNKLTLLARNASGGSVAEGEVWRLLTWPIPNDPSFWTLILFAVFFMIGSQLEASMGRKTFAVYLAIMVIVPAVLVTLIDLAVPLSGGIATLRAIELGVLVGFAARMPRAQFMFGIPAWGVAGALVVLELLQSGTSFPFVTVLVVVAVSLVTIRSMGYAEQSPWIPAVPLPARSTGPSRSKRQAAPSTAKRKRRGRAKLSVVPPPAAGSAPRKELTKLEAAEMDALLEQVSDQGLDSLTQEQRQRLETHSKRLRRRGE